MKICFVKVAAVAVALVQASLSHAAVSILDSTYSFSTYHNHSVSSECVVSFDWDNSDGLYYQTSTSSFSFGGLFKWDGATQTTAVTGNSSLFAGASAVRIGDNLYYNTSDFSNTQFIAKYGPLSSSPSSSNISTANNWGLYRRSAGEMFITGVVGSGLNEVFYATLDSSGNFTSAPLSLGLTIGSSGPIAFDSSNNMYYAPGFGDLKIYKFTSADVAAAIADPTNNPLPSPSSRLWRNYSSDFSNVSGATGMAFDASGNLLLTLTDFMNPSYLVRFDVDAFGDYAGFSSILSSTTRLGDVRFKDASIYLANENTILQVVPEPRTVILLALSFISMSLICRKRVKS